MPVAHCRIGPSNGSAAAIVCSGVPSAGHFSGSTTRSAPAFAASRVRRSAVARLRSRSGVDCSWTAAARTRFSFPDGLTRQSTSISFGSMALRKSWRWVGAFGPDADAVRRARAGRRAAPVVVGGVGRRASARGQARAVRAVAGARDADRGHDRAGVDAQDAAARDAARCSGARSTCPGCSTSPPAATRGGPPGAGRRARAWPSRARPSCGTSSRASTTAHRSERTVWVDGEPHEVGALAVRRPGARRRPRFDARRHAGKARELPRDRLRLRATLRHLHRLAARRRPARAGGA